MDNTNAEDIGSQGAFADSLARNNRQIRKDRAQAIIEDTQLIYKRKIEDLEALVKKMRREQEGMLDLSPTTTTNLTMPSDFDSTAYVDTDLDLGVKIRNTEIKIEIANKRFNFLFGGK